MVPPCVALAIFASVPFADAYDGYQANWKFRIASATGVVAAGTFALGDICPVFGVPASWKRVCAFAVPFVVVVVGLHELLGATVGFPVPMAMPVCCTPGFFSGMTGFYFTFSKATRADRQFRRAFAFQLLTVNLVFVFLLVYALYYNLFSRLQGAHQALFAMLWPSLKVAFKNLAQSLIMRAHNADAAPLVVGYFDAADVLQ